MKWLEKLKKENAMEQWWWEFVNAHEWVLQIQVKNCRIFALDTRELLLKRSPYISIDSHCQRDLVLPPASPLLPMDGRYDLYHESQLENMAPGWPPTPVLLSDLIPQAKFSCKPGDEANYEPTSNSRTMVNKANEQPQVTRKTSGRLFCKPSCRKGYYGKAMVLTCWDSH